MKKLMMFLSLLSVSGLLLSAKQQPTVTSTTKRIIGSIASYAYHNPIKTTAAVLVLTDIAIRGLDNSLVSKVTECAAECGEQIIEDGHMVQDTASYIADTVVNKTTLVANTVSGVVKSVVQKIS